MKKPSVLPHLLKNGLGFFGHCLCQEPALLWVVHFPLKTDLSTAFLLMTTGRIDSPEGTASSYLCPPLGEKTQPPLGHKGDYEGSGTHQPSQMLITHSWLCPQGGARKAYTSIHWPQHYSVVQGTGRQGTEQGRAWGQASHSQRSAGGAEQTSRHAAMSQAGECQGSHHF